MASPIGPALLLLLALLPQSLSLPTCADYTVAACAPEEEELIDTYTGIPGPAVCQALCRIQEGCGYFRHFRGSLLCGLFHYHYLATCGIIGGPAEPAIDSCSGQAGGCGAFRGEDCPYLGDIVLEKEAITDPHAGQQLLATLGVIYHADYFTFDSSAKVCTLFSSMDRDCDAVSGPSLPDIESCETTWTTIACTTTTTPSASTTTTTTVTTQPTQTTSSNPPPNTTTTILPPCQDYLLLDSQHRNVDTIGPPAGVCDNLLCCDNSGWAPPSEVPPDWRGDAWYRLAGQAGTRLVEDRPGPDRCGTSHPGYLTSSHPGPQEGLVTRTVSFDDFESVEVDVINCGELWVYHLADTPIPQGFPLPSPCYMGYCGV
jgi:hypothetical protein